MKTLIINTLQNDFHPLGMAAIEGSDQLIPKINALSDNFDLIIAVQIWYPADHIIFAANHLWRKPNQIKEIDGKEIELTEMYCIAESFGAEMMSGLRTEKIRKFIRIGTNKNVPLGNAFYDSNGESTGLKELLAENKIKEIHLAGLNPNQILVRTQKAAEAEGFKVTLLSDCCIF